MRIFTTVFFLTCAVFFFSAFDAFGVPDITVVKIKDACGGNANGSFVIRVNSATGTGNLTFQVFGSPPYSNPAPTTIPMPGAFPFEFTVNGAFGGQTYLVVVTQSGGTLGGFDNDFAPVQDFSAAQGAVVNNSDPTCTAPNGSIAINMSGAGQGAFQFSWSGPAGFVDPHTQNLSNLKGGSYTLTYTDSNPLGVTSCSLPPIVITDPAASDFTISTTTPSVCQGTGFNIDVSQSDVGYTYSVVEGATTHASSAGTGGTLSIAVPALAAGSHTIQVTAIRGTCPPKFNSPSDVTVTVNSTPVYTTGPAPAQCSNVNLGTDLATFKSGASVVATSFTVTAINPQVGLGVVSVPSAPRTGGANLISTDRWQNTSNGTLSVDYTVVPTAGTCPGASFVVTVPVNPQPDFNNLNAPAVCSGVAIGVTLDPLKKATSVAAVSYVIDGINPHGMVAVAGGPIPGPATNTSSADDAWRNLTSGVLNVDYLIRPRSSNGCFGAQFTVSVPISPQPDYNDYTNNNAPLGICSEDPLGVDITLLKKATSGIATSFVISSVNSNGLPGAGGSPGVLPISDDQWTNTTTANVDVVYQIRPVIGSCQGNLFTVRVTIKPEPFAPPIPKTICSRDNVNVNLQTQGIDLGNQIANTTFVWKATLDNPNVSGESLTDQTSVTLGDVLVNASTGVQVVTYSVTPTSPAACVGNPFAVTVTVNPEPVAPAVPKAICSGDNVNVDLQIDAINLGNSLASTTFVWAATADNASVTGESLTPQTGGTINDVLVNSSAADQTVDYLVTPTSSANCVGTPFTVSITIHPRPAYTDFDNSAGGGICADPIGVDLDALKNPGTVTAATYDIMDIQFVGLNAVGAQTVTGPLPLLNVATGEIADDVWANPTTTNKQVIYQIIPKTGTCAGAQFEVRVTIKPQPVYTAGAATVCSGTPVLFDLNSTKAGGSVTATSFDVSFIADSNLTPISGIAPGGAQPANAIADDIWQNITNTAYTVDYTITPNENGCAGGSFHVIVTIDPEPVYTTSSLVTVCSEDMLGIDLEDFRASTSVVAATFDVAAVPASGLVPVGATSTPTTGNNLQLSDDQWRNATAGSLTVTYTIAARSAANCLATVAFDVPVSVTPQPDYNNYNDLTGICAVPLGVDITTLQKLNTTPATTFDVTLPTNLTQIAGAGTPTDLTDDVWQNVTAAAVDIVYHIIPKNGTCVGDEFTVTVRINPQPDYAPFTGTICSKDAVGVDLTGLKAPASIAATSFNISIVADPRLILTNADATIISDDIWRNLTGVQLPVTYNITPKAGTCDGAPFTVTINVDSEPTAPPIFKTICTGSNVNLNLQTGAIDLGNGIASTGFQWQVNANNPNVSGISVGMSNTSLINDPLVNNTTVDQVVVYDVIPTSPDGCVGDLFKVTVTVATKPVVAAGQTAEICSNTAVGYTILLNPVGQPAGTTFSWQAANNSNVSGASTAAPKTGDIITDVLVNNGAGPEVVTYTVTPTLGSCVGVPVDILVTVNLAYTAEAGPAVAICTDAGPYKLNGSSVGGAASTGTWTLFTNPGDGAIDQENNPLPVPSDAFFSATAPGDYVLRLETDGDPSGICSAGVDFVTITVTNKPVITPGQTALVCGNDPVGYEVLLTPAGLPLNTVFNWPDPDGPTGTTAAAASPPGGVPMGTAGTKHINDILINETSANIPLSYDVTPSVGLCVGAMETIVITVKPSPVVAFGQTKTICSGERVDLELLLSPANLPGGTTFSWPDPDGVTGSGTSKDNIPADPAGTIHITDTLFNASGVQVPVVYKVISKGINGCYGRTRDVTINVNSGAVVNAGPAQSICANGILTLSAASVAGAADATWTIVSGPAGATLTPSTATATPQTTTFQSATAGTYTLQLTSGAPTVGTCPSVSDVVVVTVKAPGDPSCTGGTPICPAGAPAITATLFPTDATCANNDGSILVSNLTGGSGVFTFELNGQAVNLPASKTFAGLTANNYNLIVRDDQGCEKIFSPTLVSFPGFINHSVPVITEPDCNGGGANGKVEFTISDPGSFQFAFTTDLIVEPTTYNTLGGTLVSVPNLSRGDYAVWLRPVGAGVKCPTKVPVSIQGIYQVSYTATTSDVQCFGSPTSIVVNNMIGAPGLPYNYTLTNTADNSVTTGSISASQALAAFSITGINKGNYSLLITQDQSSLIACPTPINGGAKALVVDGPTHALDTLFVKKAISVPDLPSGSALVGVAPSGLDPYEVRLELTQPLFAGQEYVVDWSNVSVNPQSLKYEYSFTNLYAGIYTLGVRDAGGCEKIYVFDLDVDTDLFIPNIFTPNGDDHNEVFYIRNLPSESKLLITNRWGKEVYKTSSYQNDWNGGDTVDGMYYYTLSISGKSYTGWVEILRGQ